MGPATPDTQSRPGRHEHFVTSIQDRSLLALGLVTFAGITLVAAGWVIQGRAYVPGLLMQLGTALMLLVPLALLGFVLENRMRRAEEQIRATAAQLDTLTAATRQQLSEHRRQREELFGAAKQDPAQGMIRALLDEAVQIGAIVPEGARVQMPGSQLRLRFRPDGTDVMVQVEELDGSILGAVPWHSGEDARVFAQRLAAHLQASDRYPGDTSFDPTAVLQKLLKLVQLGVESRTGERPRDFGPLIEIPNEQWAISADGLFSLQRPYRIQTRQIVGSAQGWPQYMRTQDWVDAAAFDEAYLLAQHLLQAGNEASAQ
jgi:hypothetical protein